MGLGGSTHPGSAVPCLGMAQIQHKAVRVCKKTSQALWMPRETIITIFLSDSSLGSGHPTRHRLWINTAGLLDFWIKKYKVAHKERVGLQKSVCPRNSTHISHRNNGDKAERGGDLLPSSSSLHPNPPWKDLVWRLQSSTISWLSCSRDNVFYLETQILNLARL